MRIKSEKRATVADPGQRHLTGRGVAAVRAGLSTTSPAGVAAIDPDSAPNAKPVKVNCRLDEPSGHPCYDCPDCGTVHAQSVCPAECEKCGRPMKEGTRATRGPAPAASNGSDVRKGKLSELVAATAPKLSEVPIDRITPSRHNPRKTFDDDDLAELVASIRQHGIIQRLVVRPECSRGRFELIAGERRWRAAKAAGLKTVPIEVRDATDRECALLRLEENFRRADLNPIDQALAFQEATTIGGFTQQELADSLGLTQGAIANKIRLLKVPAGPLRDRIISGDITEKEAREDLCPWADVAGVLEAAGKKKGGSLERHVGDELRSRSRSMEHQGWRSDDCRFKPSPADLKALDVRKVGWEKRAFNVELWDKLQKVAEERAEKREAAGHSGTESAAERREKAEKLADQFDRRLERWKLAWLQRQIADRVVNFDDAMLFRLLLHFSIEWNSGGLRARRDEMKSLLRAKGVNVGRESWNFGEWKSMSAVPADTMRGLAVDAITAWVQHDLERAQDFSQEAIEKFAKELGIDPAKHWSVDESFLKLHTSSQLCELAEEWGIGGPLDSGRKRSELIAWLLTEGKDRKCPRALLGKKSKSKR